MSSSWSPLHELVPETPLRHGHAISIDMAFSATLANSRKLISDEEHRRILNLFSRAGLSMDHPDFNEEILDKATQAILKTRDGKLRAAVPNPIGTCTFINDADHKELCTVLKRHKELMKEYPQNGEGIEAYVDASDTGYTETNVKAVKALEKAAEEAGSLNGNGHIHGGNVMNGYAKSTNGVLKKMENGHANGHANGITNGTNSFTNGARA
jgi:3-dehydroquinate synthase